MAEHANLESLFSDIADELRKKGCAGDSIKFTPCELPTSDIESVCFGRGRYEDEGKFVAVSGIVTTNPLYSNDGITWTEASAPTGGNMSIYPYYICCRNGQFIAVGVDASLNSTGLSCVSLDGVSWNSLGNCGVPLSPICSGNGKLVMIGAYLDNDNGDWSQSTGTEDFFTVRNGEASAGIPRETNGSICYGKGKFVATRCGSENFPLEQFSLTDESEWELLDDEYKNWSDNFLYSNDGITWEKGSMPAGVLPGKTLVYGNGIFLNVGQSVKSYLVRNCLEESKLLYSFDGTNWDVVPQILLDISNLEYNPSDMEEALCDDIWFEKVCYCGGVFVALGARFNTGVDRYRKLAYSTDLIHWVSDSEHDLDWLTWDETGSTNKPLTLGDYKLFQSKDKFFITGPYKNTNYQTLQCHTCEMSFVADRFNKQIASMFGRIISNDTDIVPTGQYATDTNYSESYGVKIGYCPNGDIMVSMMKVGSNNGPLHFSVVREGDFDGTLEYTTSFKGQEGIYTCVVSGITKLSEMSVSMDEIEILNTGDTAIKCLITITAL